MKKVISLALSATLALSSMMLVSAADDGIKVYLEGSKINFDVQPQSINNRTMVPIRAIFEAMGANVSWDDTTKSAISTKDSTTVKMTLNSTTEYINGVAYEMDVTPVIIDGRALAPARYVAEAFGYYVNWDEMTKSVLISKNSSVENTTNNIKNNSGVTEECKAALEKAKSYSDLLHMSKAGIYVQLTSEYGEKLTAAETQYAIDNLQVDYKINALEKAKSYSDTLHMSKAGIYVQLTSEYGEKFTAAEAQYAIDNLQVDYKINALEKAKSYRDTLNMSKSLIYDQLTSEYGEQFTAEEAQYAIDNLE